MRITASWSGSSPTEYKDVARMFVLPHAGSPPIVIPTTASVPSCSNPSRTKPLRVARYAPSLTASARASFYATV